MRWATTDGPYNLLIGLESDVYVWVLGKNGEPITSGEKPTLDQAKLAAETALAKHRKSRRKEASE